VCGHDCYPQAGDLRIPLAPFVLAWQLHCAPRLLKHILRVSPQRQREFEGLEN
jgi:hypothetical protein